MTEHAPHSYAREARAARRAAPRGGPRGGPGGREAAREGQVHRARADREAAGSGLLPGARRVRAPPHAGLRDGREPPARRCGDHRPRDDRRPPGVRVQPGLHGLRRLAGRGDGREDLQGDGPRGARRLPADRDQRLGRRADPGGRRRARRLRRGLLPQRALLGRDPADLAGDGAVRGRRRVFARDHGLHLHGQGDLAHVHHRAGRDPHGDPRGGRARGAGRSDDAQREVGRRALRRGGRGPVPRGCPLPDLVPAAEQPLVDSRAAADRRSRADGRRARRGRSRQPEEGLRHARR